MGDYGGRHEQFSSVSCLTGKTVSHDSPCHQACHPDGFRQPPVEDKIPAEAGCIRKADTDCPEMDHVAGGERDGHGFFQRIVTGKPAAVPGK